jgi:hypothetical protein
MGFLRSLLFGIALLLFLVLAAAANVGTWALGTFLDSETFAVTTSRIISQPEVRQLLAERLAERLTDQVVPSSGAVPASARAALHLSAGATPAQARQAVRDVVAAVLSDPDTIAIEGEALADLHRSVLSLIGSAGDEPTGAESITLDLSGVIDAVDRRLGGRGDGQFLGVSVPPDLGNLTLVSVERLQPLAWAVQLLETMRWLLPAMAVCAAVLVLALARSRLHAVAWLGLVLVLVGTLCLLAASSAPILASRLFGSAAGTRASAETTIDGLMAGLLTQSAVLAGLGLAMLVVGITAGIVTGRGAEDQRRDAYA